MPVEINNPFQITKAVDFSDDEINQYWVDFPTEGGFQSMMNPVSPMPMLILGGKGSGKTHLMRYYSYNLQKLRNPDNILKSVKSDGYLGIYLRLGGLNAKRFTKKNVPPEVWNNIYCFYMDLSLSQILFNTVIDLFSDSDELKLAEKDICASFLNLFDEFKTEKIETLDKFIEIIDRLRKKIDYEINNCAITGTLDVKILSSPGKLVFGFPKILSEKLPSLENILFLYLLDEIENLNEDQQKYLNTLVREKESPSSFKIGARLYGTRTTLTYSADEEIKEGSEFERILLDAQFRNKNIKESYKQFAASLCLKRLNKIYSSVCKVDSHTDCLFELGQYFENQPQDDYYETITKTIVSKYQFENKPYIKKLKKQLVNYKPNISVPDKERNNTYVKILNYMKCDQYPIFEKFKIFLLYKDWYHKKNIDESAYTINKSCNKYIHENIKDDKIHSLYQHWKKDLLAQLYRECDRKLVYCGIETLIDMSHGIPRNLLIILKHIYKWAIFNGENPFVEGQISIRSQMQGVKDASEWFFQDARPSGENGWMLRESISRLAQLFREFRFSDKPSEVSLNTFSTDWSKISENSKKMISLAEKWSLLVLISGGQKDRNTKRIDRKYQLNRMLSPRWNLPIERRGAISLNEKELNSIFDNDCKSNFDDTIKIRLARLNVPFTKNNNNVDPQQTIEF